MCTDSLKALYEKNITIFLTTWNQLRVSLVTNGTYNTNSKYSLFTDTSTGLSHLHDGFKCCCSGEIKIPVQFCQKDLDLHSDFKVLLPQRSGPGLCSTALVSYLIALHNDLVYCVDKHTEEETRWGCSCHIFFSFAQVLQVNFFLQIHNARFKRKDLNIGLMLQFENLY